MSIETSDLTFICKSAHQVAKESINSSNNGKNFCFLEYRKSPDRKRIFSYENTNITEIRRSIVVDERASL